MFEKPYTEQLKSRDSSAEETGDPWRTEEEYWTFVGAELPMRENLPQTLASAGVGGGIEARWGKRREFRSWDP